VQRKQGSVISSADWKLDPLELANKFNSKTKMIIVFQLHKLQQLKMTSLTFMIFHEKMNSRLQPTG